MKTRNKIKQVRKKLPVETLLNHFTNLTFISNFILFIIPTNAVIKKISSVKMIDDSNASCYTLYAKYLADDIYPYIGAYPYKIHVIKGMIIRQ